MIAGQPQRVNASAARAAPLAGKLPVDAKEPGSMEKLQLTCALTSNAQTAPIIGGAIAPEGVDLVTTPLFPSEMFLRQLKNKEFDVSEMSLSTLAIITAKGQTDWVGIPVFPTRRFFHTRILIRSDRGIEKPSDLAGKTVGVPEYQQTAALWSRAALRSEYGVDSRSMRWVMERDPAQSHGGATGFTPPAGIELDYVPAGKTINQMLVDGELDALIHYIYNPNSASHANFDPLSGPDVRYLFPDRAGEAHRYYAETKIYPINHVVIVRRSIVEQHPWLIGNIYDAFETVKTQNSAALAGAIEPFAACGVLDAGAVATTKTDVMPYGIKRSRHVLETIARSVYADGLASRVVGLDEIFALQSLDT
jgi:4,5-dihydroxyphthalate decarboxylase